MKNIKMAFMLLCLVIMLCGCGRDIYLPPSAVTYNEEENRLTWEGAENASSYLLIINGTAYEVSDNYFLLDDFSDGAYEVKIKSVYPKGESPFSDAYVFTVITAPSYNVYEKEGLLYFTAVPGAVYRVVYQENLETKTVSLVENVFVVPESLKDKNTIITVFILSGANVIHETEVLYNMNITRVFKDEPFVIEVAEPKSVYIDGIKINDGFALSPGAVTLSPALIGVLENESVVSVCGAESAILRLLPAPARFVLEGPEIRTFSGEHIVFSYDLKGYELTRISSAQTPELTADNYDFDNGRLVVYKEYIDAFFSENPGIDLVLSLSFSFDDYNEIVYVTILSP